MIDYKPEHADRYEQMLLVFGHCDTEEELTQATLLFIIDMSYPRPDICHAQKVNEQRLRSAAPPSEPASPPEPV